MELEAIGSKSCSCYFLSCMTSCKSLASLNLSFLICKMGIKNSFHFVGQRSGLDVLRTIPGKQKAFFIHYCYYTWFLRYKEWPSTKFDSFVMGRAKYKTGEKEDAWNQFLPSPKRRRVPRAAVQIELFENIKWTTELKQAVIINNNLSWKF